ncbi:pilus assembly protein [Alkanindiges illinoisensis]|uniref:Pilus assembly protein n=1 Tax=Alkanindiges illinoisensis TaxID=197183 RepID=A0A4Y7XF01_9GAMM|nr:pilus assembly protein [Alkanindiges illinoisensis]TEU29266.1 pilus assembly protein [Alkanindiges illinoisensis]
MKTFKLNMITRTIWLPFLLIPTATTLHASDLEIYKASTGGTATIMLMLDTSGSMGYGDGYQTRSYSGSMSIETDYGVCTDSTGYNTVANNPVDSGTSPSYKRYFCPVTVSAASAKVKDPTTGCEPQKNSTGTVTGYRCYDRLTRLKDALFKLMDDSTIKTDTAIGLGNFSAQGDGRRGQILVPAKPLNTLGQRTAIKTQAALLSANNGTPSAHAYAEAAAYLLGNATATFTRSTNAPRIVYRTYTSGRLNTRYYNACSTPAASVTYASNGSAYQDCASYGGDTTTNPNSSATKYGNDNNYDYYTVSGSLPYASNISDVNSGMPYAYTDSTIVNSSNKYISPLSQTDKSCNGQGIYFLTDGFPNSSSPSAASTIMKSSLGSAGSGFSCTVTTSQFPNPKNSDGTDDTTGAWQCIASFAKTLNDTANNSFGQPIKTAVVGFGSDLAGVPKNADGTYNCNAASNNDARNACNWGNKGSGYGEGGFYLGSNSEDVVSSIKQFVSEVTPPFKASSIGTISIPRDPLDATKSMNTGFFPMIQPTTDTSRRTWLGNLKKYYVLNGALKDSVSTTGGNSLYNSDQSINSAAKDIWSIQSGGDHSLITSGGALNKIPVPSSLSVTGEPSNSTSERRVFIIDNSVLKRVSRESLAVDYPSTSTNPAPLTSTTTTSIAQRYALLNYLGYKTTYPPAADATLNTADLATLAPVPANPYRFLGGVVHSSPLVVTKQAKVYSTVSGGQITESATRDKTEYVVYGSMDGGLHIVDAASGLEQSVFVPREILDNQPETLASTEATGTIPTGLNSALAYGVDAPWVADNTFKATSTKSSGTTTTTYTALTMNVYGGLRMGGSALYGLNISTPTSPTLLFRITPSTSGFSRMGQIWNKPVVAYVRYNKVRTKVLIFGGGYDEAYETTYKTSNPTGSTTTKGNAVYIVKADDGTLLWSGSSDSTAGKNLQNSNMKYSIVGQPAVRDYNADGLVDAIWVADLGGQVFRIDLNNAIQNTSTFSAVRIATLAQLNSNLRFYERPATAVFEEGQNRFILVSVGSGNRSFPLQKDATINKVYGLIDMDATADNLESSDKSASNTNGFTQSAIITESDLVTTGVLGKSNTKQNSTTDVESLKNYVKGSGTQKKGWAFSLKGVNTSTETGTATDGYAKAFEEPQLLSANLYFSIFDPNATLSGAATNSCTGGVRGLSTIYRMCMPYGDCAAYSAKDSIGIIGIPIGPVGDDPRITRIVTPDPTDSESCIGNCSTGPNTQLTGGTGFKYTQGRSIRPIRWYEW